MADFSTGLGIYLVLGQFYQENGGKEVPQKNTEIHGKNHEWKSRRNIRFYTKTN